VGSLGRPVNRAVVRGADLGLPASLIRLHRNSRANLLVTGGSRAQRLAIVHEFHRASPLAGESFVAIDCARDEAALARSLEQWLLASAAPGDGDDGGQQGGGVLYLDSIAALSTTSQRLLLMIAHRLQGHAADVAHIGPRRLMAGDPHQLARAAQAGRFSSALFDHLDKIRVELGRRLSRGVA
jgi:DNA-binding NtrC family response regulator